MPYISSTETKEIKKALKAHFPRYRFSVTKEHHTGVAVSILSGPIDFFEEVNLEATRFGASIWDAEGLKRDRERGYHQVNHFYIEDHWLGEARDTLALIYRTITDTKPRKIICEDGDYGSIPNYYISINIGKWNKPYERKEQ